MKADLVSRLNIGANIFDVNIVVKNVVEAHHYRSEIMVWVGIRDLGLTDLVGDKKCGSYY